ncbi:protein S40-7-like isoform X1 [Salvia miltiorrhiza]|uniref:protein S40-7-like isoform X1 n=1 Tax=Salvia miltiorrhiza TaxID=226208 RepID=UPI0025ABC8A3|nr:protein S40-7-like isoform X1 [Salvia miltiorrhiza]
MEQIGGAAAATRFRRQHHHKPAERFLGVLQPQSPSAAPPIELSEDDIFSTPSGCSSPPPPTHRNLNSTASAVRSDHRNHYGILAALNGSIGSRSGSEHGIQPVFNHKASIAASISSSSSASASPATPLSSSRMLIPRPPRPRADRVRVYHQSAPVNIPVMPRALRRRAMEQDDAVSEGEQEEDDGVRLPPHEVVDSRQSPLLACSVLEGAGRTLKGRDLRQFVILIELQVQL